MGYDRADRSNVSDPELVDLLARYLRRRGVADVAVLEAPTVYGPQQELASGQVATRKKPRHKPRPAAQDADAPEDGTLFPRPDTLS